MAYRRLPLQADGSARMTGWDPHRSCLPVSCAVGLSSTLHAHARAGAPEMLRGVTLWHRTRRLGCA